MQSYEVQKVIILSTLLLSQSVKTPHTHRQYVHNKYTKFEKDSLKLWEESITQTLYY